MLPECMLKDDLCVRSMPIAMFLSMKYRICVHVPRIIASVRNFGGPNDLNPPPHFEGPLGWGEVSADLLCNIAPRPPSSVTMMMYSRMDACPSDNREGCD